MWRSVAVTLLLTLLSTDAQSAPLPDEPSTESVILKLGSPRYSEREQASRELHCRGEAALPALEQATTHEHPEIRRRAAAIAARIRRESVSRTWLASAPITYACTDWPLEAAVADFRDKTRLNLVLLPDLIKDPHRKVSMAIGPLPPWEAFEAFLTACGLHEEEFFEPTPFDTPRRQDALMLLGGMSSSHYFVEPRLPLPGAMPIGLADGLRESRPADRTKTVRVAAMSADYPGNRVIRGAGEVVIHLEIIPLPELRWHEVSQIRITRIEDEHGQGLQRADPPSPPNPFSADVIIANNLVGFAGNLIVDHAFDGLPPRHPDNPRVSPIHVHTRDRTVKRLKVLEGVVVGELNLPEQTLVDIPNLARAVGRVHHGPNDARLTIVSHEPKQHGRWLSIRLRVEATPAATMPRLGLRNRIAMSNNSPVMPGVGIALAAGLGEARFYDDAGRLISPPPGNWTTDTIDGSRQIQEIELNFPLSGGIPVRMKAIGHKSVSVDVPFRIHNLPLP